MALKTRILSVIATLFCCPWYYRGISVLRNGNCLFPTSKDIIRYGLALQIDFDVMSFKNYKYLFTGNHAYFTWFKNSLVLTLLSVVLTLIVCYFVAYGLSMYKFKLRNFLFFLVIATMMVPFEILMLPLFKK